MRKLRVAWIGLALVLLFGTFSLSSCKKDEKVHTRYEITAEYMPYNETLTGTVKVRFENYVDGELSILKFQLYPNAYREGAKVSPIESWCENTAYYQGKSYGEMVISSVNGAKNWEVLGEDNNVLYAYLEKSLFPGDEVVLDIGFMVKLPKQNHRLGVCPQSVNLAYFFPVLCGMKNGGFYETLYYGIGDAFYLDVADYRVSLTVPKEYVVASSGETVGERILESKKEHTMQLNRGRSFAISLSPHYRWKEATVGGTRLRYYYYADKQADEVLEEMQETFGYYNQTFGDYPYAHYTLAQTGLTGAGAEYSCFSMLSDCLSEEEKHRTVAHEVAHQWWYSVVGSDQILNAWQDEGLAEYSALTFFERYEKYGISRETAVGDALKEYRSYYDVYGSVLGRTDTKMTRHLKDYVSDYEYKCLTYDKAIVMLDTLRKTVDDETFFNGLKKYYRANAYKQASPCDLIAGFERAGVDAEGFFQSFIDGKAIL